MNVILWEEETCSKTISQSPPSLGLFLRSDTFEEVEPGHWREESKSWSCLALVCLSGLKLIPVWYLMLANICFHFFFLQGLCTP